MRTQPVEGRSKKQSNGPSVEHSVLATELLHALQSVRDGDFSVRLAGDRIGLEGGALRCHP